MMAEASPRDKELFTEQELTCSICLDLFSDPVSTPCGHNFCQGCIGGYWASSSVCTCPLCKRQFPERPQLSINRVFAHIADKFKETRYGAAGMTLLPMSTVVPGSNTNPFLEEVVLCDVCTGKKQAAVSSCLTCTASYCEEHLKPHRTTPFYASHQLLDPLEALRGRTCPIHHRLLEVFCRTDQACICAICSLHEHRTHNTVSIQTERIVKQKLLGKTELEIQKRVEGKRLHLAELKEKLETIRNYARSEVSEMEHLLGELALAVERIRSELVGGMEEKRISVETLAEEQVACVEAELTELQQRRAALEEQATSQDHVSFLKTFQQANMPAVPDPDVDLEREPSLHFSLDEVKLALVEVKERMDDIHMGEVQPRGSRGSITSLPESESMMSVSGLRKSQWSLRDLKKIKPKSGLKKVKCYQEDVMLNPVTAYPFLILSDDRKQVKRGEKLQFYRNSSHRFDVWSCVLAKEGFNSGRHYWEVNVGENKDWKVGVVKESAQRKGLFDMSPVSGYYALWWGGTQLRALTTPPLTKVKSPIRLRRVGVYLDCEEGQVTFYNAKTGNEVHSFNVSEFSERMFPLLGTGDKEVPLVLMTAQYSSVPE